MQWQGYFYIENLGLNAQQKPTLVSALQSWGLQSRLAELFGVNVDQVNVSTSQNQYGDVAIFSYNNVDRLRVGVFAGRQVGYATSQAAAQQFIIDFASAWQE